MRSSHHVAFGFGFLQCNYRKQQWKYYMQIEFYILISMYGAQGCEFEPCDGVLTPYASSGTVLWTV